MRSVIYTAIFGNYDDLKEPQVITPEWEYICYTDNPDLKSDVWKVIKTDQISKGPQYSARRIKILFHKFAPADRSIWMDGSFVINCNLDEFWKNNFQSSFTAPRHPYRDCVYEEADACLRNKRDDALAIANQVSKYLALKVPAHNGMISSGILMRESAVDTISFCERWWEELSQNSVRDQIAFGRIDFEIPGVVKKFSWDYRENNDFTFTTHLNKRHYGFRVRRKRKRLRKL